MTNTISQNLESLFESDAFPKLSRRAADDIIALTKKMTGQKLVIVGDVGVDEYVIGNVRRISPEAPVPVVEVQSQMKRLGLSTNVAQNVAGLGSEALLVSVVGKDTTADELRSILNENGVSSDHLIVDPSRPTTRKLRVMAQNHHVVRVDYEQRQFIQGEVAEQVVRKAEALMSKADGLIIQDYAKGVLSETVCQQLIKSARGLGKKIMVDPNRNTPIAYYRGADIMTPNHDEALQLAGISVDDLRGVSDSMMEVGEALMKGIQSKTMIITRGKDGMSLFQNGKGHRIPTFAREVFDVTGAGDTVIAALALGWVGGLTLDQACVLANYAAGVVVGKVGCVPCSLDELKEYILACTSNTAAGGPGQN